MSGRRRVEWLLAAVWVLCAAPVFAAEGRTQEASLVIGTGLDYPPYSFLDENGKPTGYSVELTQAIARVMELDIEVRIGPWAEIRQALERGEIDAISGMFYSVERDRVVDFSPPYTVIHHAIFVRRDAPAIETEEDVRSKDVIVMRGDIMHEYVLEKGLCDNPVLVDTQADALRLVASGAHDCALVAKLPGLYWARELGLSNLVTVWPLLRPSDYSYAVTEGDAALLARLAEGLAIVEKTGKHKEVYDRWLGVLEPRGVSSGTVILYVALAAAPPLLLLAILAVWSRTLKSQVARRTEDLRASEKRFRAIFEQAAVGAAQIETPTGQFVRVNKRYCDILGLTPDEMTAATFMEITHPDDLQEDLANMERLKTGEIREFSMEKRYFRRDGSIVWVNLTVSPMWEPGESQNYHVAVVEDITDRKRAEEALRKANEHLTAMFDALPDLLFEVDQEGLIYDYHTPNPNLLYAPTEVFLDKNLSEVLPVEAARIITQAIAETAETGTHSGATFSLKTRAGVKWFELSIAVKGSKTPPARFVTLVREITERKRAVQRIEGLHRLNEDLLGSRSVAEKMKRVTDGVVEILGADFARIWITKQGDLCDSGCMHAKVSEGPHVCRARNQCLHLVASSGRYTHIDGETHRRVPFGCYKIGRVASAEEPGFLTNDAVHDPRVHNPDWARELGLAAFAGHRLVSPEGSPIGVLSLFSKQALSSSDEALLQTIAGTASKVLLVSKSVDALRESEERFRDLAKLLPQTVYEMDLEGRLTFVNQNAFEIFGFSEKDLEAGLSNLDVLAPEDRERARRNVECILRGETSVGNEYVALRNDGSRFPVVIYSAPIVRQDRPAGLRGIIVDITERKQAEEALQQSEERLTGAQRVAKLGHYFLDITTGHWTSSVGLDDVFGINDSFMKDVAGWLKIVHPEFREIMSGYLQDHVLRQHREFDKEYKIIHFKTGQERWVHGLGILRFEEKGDPIEMLGTIQDITDRKQAEEEKLALERQVQHAQKLESLGVLAGGIAHDFNNLLMGILGNADLALNELSPMSPARGNLQAIEAASKRAAGLAKQMLAYSGKGRFVVEPIDARELVEEMAHLLDVSISKKVVLKYNFAENLPTFDGDVTQIRQVVMNLITNASEAIGEGSGVIALSTGAMHCDRAYLDDVNESLRAGLDEPLPEGVYSYLEVADTGCGMDAKTIDKLFDPFFTTKFTGRGLGMSAVLGIVRGHAGAIKIYSEVGKGTTFKLLFPAHERPPDGIAVRRSDEADGKDWRGSGTVLIADDEEMVCAVGKQMLERLGFRVVTACDGREALKVFGEHADEIVCVLLDLTMPHLDGEEAFREMRRLRPGVSVILCSGYNEQDATQRFAGKGLAGFIQKPFTTAALTEKLMDVLAAGEGEQ